MLIIITKIAIYINQGTVYLFHDTTRNSQRTDLYHQPG